MTYQTLFQKYRSIPEEKDQIKADPAILRDIFQDNRVTPLERLNRLEGILLPGIFVSLEDLQPALLQGLDRMAHELGKDIPELILNGPGIYLQPATAHLLTDCLGHLLRNAMDHGLEKSDERRAAGKSSQGRIVLEGRVEGEQLKILFGDDGRGLLIETIRSKALARSLLEAHEELTETRLEKLIFSPGFSTKNEASMISGRGVGLDAVRAALEHEGGRIALKILKRDDGQGAWHFHFEIQLPGSTFITVDHKHAEPLPNASSRAAG